ncbi:MAG: hypothetical protein AAGA87_07715 [Pseudomonadota bacterium]
MAIFALDLDHDGIRLLREAGGRWDVVDHVALDDRKLAGRLRRMRHTAVLATDACLETILIIPNWQIFYTTLSLPSDGLPPDEEWIAASLDGMTGCPVDEMKFDWRTTPEGVYVAALDVNTLDEAESFATQHGFNPVRFSARPDIGDFPDMPDFGPTEFVRHQTNGERAVLFESRRAPEATNVFADIAEPAPGPAPTFATSRSTEPEPTVAFETRRQEPVALPDDAPIVVAEAPAALPPMGPAADTVSIDAKPDLPVEAPAPQPLAEPEPVAADAPQIHSTAPETPTVPAVEDETVELPSAIDAMAIVRTAIALTDIAPDALPDLDETPAPALAVVPKEAVEEAVAEETTTVADEETTEISEEPALDEETAEAAVEEEIAEEVVAEVAEPAPEAEAEAEPEVDEEPELEAEPEVEDDLTDVEEVDEAPAEPEPAVTITAVPPPPAIQIGATATLPDRLRPIPGALRSPQATSDTDRRGPTAFRLEPEEPRPTDWRRIGLTTAAAASVIAALVWTALTLVAPDDEFAVIAARDLPNPLETPASPAAPEVEPALERPGNRILPEVQTVSFDPTAPAMDRDEVNNRRVAILGPDAAIPAEDPTVEDADVFRAATVWMTPPPLLLDPAGDTLDQLYLAAIDPTIPLDDALALPNAAPDFALSAPAAPPALGQRFDLDERGLVRATPDGAETPDGITVFAGQPALTPPLRPTPEVTEPSAEVPRALAGKLPRQRPTDLIERNERNQWGGRTLQELAGLRPETRPGSVQDIEPVESASLFPSDFAVGTSRVPASRPTDFQAVVAAAQVRANQAATRVAAATTAVPRAPERAAPAPSAAPDIPTTASVARQATISNAINLRRVNLIGVYGSASDRRALVRLPSGRYRKVQVGDSVDGGRVRQISDGQLVYTKGGRNVTLTVPSG